jgi:hypothetical protein
MKREALSRFDRIAEHFHKVRPIYDKEGYGSPSYLKAQKALSEELMTVRFTAKTIERLCDMLREQGVDLDACRLTSFPFHADVEAFMQQYDTVYVIEQNRDAQMASLLMMELHINPTRLRSVLNYDGMPITADRIVASILQQHAHIPSAS